MNWDHLITPPDEDDEPHTPCVICTGDESVPPCSEWCQHVYDSVRLRGETHRLYEACRRAIELARQYRREEWPRKSKRAAAALEQVAVWREDIRLTRAEQRKKAA